MQQYIEPAEKAILFNETKHCTYHILKCDYFVWTLVICILSFAFVMMYINVYNYVIRTHAYIIYTYTYSKLVYLISLYRMLEIRLSEICQKFDVNA